MLRWLYKTEIRTAEPTKLDVWYLEKKKTKQENKKLNETKRNEKNTVGSEA